MKYLTNTTQLLVSAMGLKLEGIAGFPALWTHHWCHCTNFLDEGPFLRGFFEYNYTRWLGSSDNLGDDANTSLRWNQDLVMRMMSIIIIKFLKCSFH